MNKATLRAGIASLQRSRKFLKWKPERIYFKSSERGASEAKERISEQHYSPTELAKTWAVDVETIRNIFREEPGVLKISRSSGKARQYVTLRIPQSVAIRVHKRLSE